MKQKIISGVLAVLISIGLWLYVVTVVNPEWEQEFNDIEVTFVNEGALEQRDLMLMKDTEYKVSLRLSGNRTDMTKLSRDNITVSVDLSRIYSEGNQPVTYSISYPEGVASNAFEVVHQSELKLNIIKLVSKKVDVEFKPADESPEGYEALLDGYQLEIRGPEDVVNRVDKIEIPIVLSDKTATFTQQFDYVLLDENNEVVESQLVTPEKALFTVTVQRFAEVELAPSLKGAEGWNIDKTVFYGTNGKAITAPIKIVGNNIDALIEDGIIKDGKLYFPIDVAREEITLNKEGTEIITKENLGLGAWLAKYGITTDADKNAVGVTIQAPYKETFT